MICCMRPMDKQYYLISIIYTNCSTGKTANLEGIIPRYSRLGICDLFLTSVITEANESLSTDCLFFSFSKGRVLEKWIMRGHMKFYAKEVKILYVTFSSCHITKCYSLEKHIPIHLGKVVRTQGLNQCPTHPICGQNHK